MIEADLQGLDLAQLRARAAEEGCPTEAEAGAAAGPFSPPPRAGAGGAAAAGGTDDQDAAVPAGCNRWTPPGCG